MGSEERAPSLPIVEECLQAQSGGSLWPETPAPGDNTKLSLWCSALWNTWPGPGGRGKHVCFLVSVEITEV